MDTTNTHVFDGTIQPRTSGVDFIGYHKLVLSYTDLYHPITTNDLLPKTIPVNSASDGEAGLRYPSQIRYFDIISPHYVSNVRMTNAPLYRTTLSKLRRKIWKLIYYPDDSLFGRQGRLDSGIECFAITSVRGRMLVLPIEDKTEDIPMTVRMSDVVLSDRTPHPDDVKSLRNFLMMKYFFY